MVSNELSPATSPVAPNDHNPPPFSVRELRLCDVLQDLVHVIEGSRVELDGITTDAALHPACDPTASNGTGGLLVTFTDETGRTRVAELDIRVRWREESCDHESLINVQLTNGGPPIWACRDCGADVADSDAADGAHGADNLGSPGLRCPSCGALVTDAESNFGVHTASCTLEQPEQPTSTPCQCEHITHETPATAHPYLGVPAGARRAVHVGPVCDECAHTHLTGYLLQGEAR